MRIKRAILIGSNTKQEYINNTEKMKDVLISKYDYEDENILIINEVTNALILRGIFWLYNNCDKNEFHEMSDKICNTDINVPIKYTYLFYYCGETFNNELMNSLICFFPKTSKLVIIVDATNNIHLRYSCEKDILGYRLKKNPKYPNYDSDIILISCNDHIGTYRQLNGKKFSDFSYSLIKVLELLNHAVTYENFLTRLTLYITHVVGANKYPRLFFPRKTSLYCIFTL